MPWEDLEPTVSRTRGVIAAVDTPVPVLQRMGFFRTGEDGRRLVFYGSRRRVLGARRQIAKAGVTAHVVCHGSLAGLPFPRRTLALVVAPLPRSRDPDLLRLLRRTAGVLEHGGLLVLHGPVRRNPLGWMLHLGSILISRRGGLPSEWDLTGWLLRGGFDEVARFELGRGMPVTMIHGHKSLP